jgi:CheY-like chemotaxis protein
MLQTSRVQGNIWRTILTSQGIDVIWQTTGFELPISLDQLGVPTRSKIDLLLIDIQTPKPNPYAFCRWFRERSPDVKVIFTNGSRNHVSPLDRRWALQQGAVELLPGFTEERNLLSQISEVVESIKLVMQVLEQDVPDQKTLLAALQHLQQGSHRETLF